MGNKYVYYWSAEKNTAKRVLKYAFLLFLFLIFSLIAETVLIKNMYKDLTGTVNGDFTYRQNYAYVDIKVIEAKATNVNGYITMEVTNKNDFDIESAYLKVDLISEKDVNAITRYLEIVDLKPEEKRQYKLKFKGSYIERYRIQAKDEYPDKENMIDFFGYQINTANIFGMDLSEYISVDSVKNFARVSWSNFIYTAEQIPWWGWFGAWTVFGGLWW